MSTRLDIFRSLVPIALCLVLGEARTAEAQGEAPAEGVVAPLVEHHHEAIYPAVELAQRKHAEVVLFVTIDAAGHVSNVEVNQSGGLAFDDAAVFAMRKWTFTPAKKGGKNIPVKIRIPFHFAPPELPAPTEVVAPGIAGVVMNPQTSKPVDEVRVRGQSYLPSRGAGDYELPIGKLAAVPRMDAASLLRLVPGVFLSNEGGTGHPYQIYLRGFDAREGQDIEFTVDGIPINEVGNIHGNGLVDTHFIIPELVRSLRVVEGPFAPQQGNFAVAGSALYDVGLSDPGFTAKAMAGSFNTKRLLLMWRPDEASDHTFAAGELFASDGFGQNRASERATAMGGYEGNLGATGSYRILATSYATHYAQAGVLREDDVVAGRKAFYDTYDTQQSGDASRHSLGVTLHGREADTRLSQSAFLIFRDFRLRENFTGYQEDPQQTWQSTHPQRGDLIDQRSQAVTFGGRGSARHPWKLFGQRQEIELGYYGRFDSIDGQQQRNRTGTTTPYRTDLNLASALSNIAIYADASLKPLPWITLRGGLRGDFYHYRVQNRCALTWQNSFGGDALDTECFSSDRQGYRSPDQTASTSSMVIQPRATLLVGPFEGFTFSVSHGRGSRSLDPQYINQGLETPFAEVVANEGGVAYVKPSGNVDVTVRSVLFRTSVDKDLFFSQTEGRNTLANGTTRTGWSGFVRATGSFFDVAANLTLVRATFDDTRLAIPYAPGAIARGDGVLFGDLPFKVSQKTIAGSVGLGVSYVGARPLPLNERSNTQFLVDAAASAKWGPFTLGVVCTNILNRQYRLGEYNYASDFRSQGYPTLVAARHFSAGEPRAIYGTLSITLDTKRGGS